MNRNPRRTAAGARWLLPIGLLAVTPALAVTRLPAQPDQALTATGRNIVIDVTANDAAGARPAVSIHKRPAHGTAAVVGGRISYTPDPGFTGRDTFEYLVKGVRSLGTATVTVDVGRALVLRGKVTDSPIVEAAVQATVDGNVFNTQADAEGNYAIEVIGLDGGMVTLAAQGNGSQAMASFNSVVGGFDRLVAEAGADGELAREENNQVQVTNLSTAQAYLMQEAMGGVPITDDAALEVAREAIDNGRLLAAAAAIQLAVDGGFELPEGVTDTLSLLNTPGALDGFVDGVEALVPGALAAAMNAIVSDPDLTVPTSVDDLIGTYTLAYDLGVPGTVNTGYIQGERLTLAEDGTGELVLPAPSADPGITWTLDPETGRAVVIPDNAPVQISYQVVEGYGQIQRASVTSRYEFALLFQGSGRDTLAMTRTTDYWYPENPEVPGGQNVGTSTVLGLRDGAGTMAFDAAELAGTTRGMAISDTPYFSNNFNGAELFSFSSDHTGQRADGIGFTWDVDASGRLQVDYGDGSSATYARVSSDGRGAEGLALDWTSSSGMRSASLQLSAVAEDFTFDAANAQADWLSGQNVSRTAYLPENTGFHVLLREQGLGWTLSLGEGFQSVVPGSWTVPGGRMEFSQYRDGDTPVNRCEPHMSNCYLYQTRRWRPVAADGNRVYVIEEFLWDTDGDGVPEVQNQRSNFYDSGHPVPFTAPRAPVRKALPAPASPGKPALRTGR